ncbi:MAG: molybdenum cofactor biosynthesis protein MoeB [Cyclobacteriaceae bacterium]|nr:MAG: molybdenum cofactor biosynthesis protein MoeB [Cyclobacteriaceae bacterium]
MKLTEKELQRYSRHLVLKEFGREAQEKLRQASVLVVGAGGLGCPLLLYLTAAGTGKIGIADFDTVQESNLQRQVLFTTEDLGRNKAEAAAKRLLLLNPHVSFQVYPFRLAPANIAEVIAPYDVVVDGSDNFATRYLVNDACVVYEKPLVYGSILQYEGQLAVFNIPLPGNRRSANYRDLFPHPPASHEVPNCEEAGVLGVLPGTIGSLMANETIKLLTGTGKVLSDKLLLFDALTLEVNRIGIPKRHPAENIKILPDYDVICGTLKKPDMKEITVHELKAMQEAGEDFQLIDVREPHENELANLGGELIPMAEVPRNLHRIARNKKVVIHCRSGGRSGNIIQWLEKNHGFENLYNLKGGILAWAREIDPSMEVE